MARKKNFRVRTGWERAAEMLPDDSPYEDDPRW
jgi:hypothetical protein